MKYFFFIIIFFLYGSISNAQSISALKQKQKDIEKSIDLINSQIEQTENQKKNALHNYNLLTQKILLKQRLIADIENQIVLLSSQISNLSNSVDSLNYIIRDKRNEYKAFIVLIQKRNFRTPILLYLLSSRSVTEAHKKIVYFNDYLNYQRDLIRVLNQSSKSLSLKKSDLDLSLIELKEKEQMREKEIKLLESTRYEQKKKSKSLSNRRKELLKELELTKSISLKLEKEIEILIAEERKKALVSSNKKVSEQNIVLSKNFSENKGKFLLPVKNGILMNNFGEKEHPILKNIKIKNNGVDISMNESSDVFTVFSGEVRKVFKIPGSKLAVMIRHGNYITVYSNLTEVFVKSGQIINTNQKIGMIKKASSNDSLVLHFEIWNENKPENPIYFFRD